MLPITPRHDVFQKFDLIVTVTRYQGFIIINSGMLPIPEDIEIPETASPLQFDSFHMGG
jgi:hypothetical protein